MRNRQRDGEGHDGRGCGHGRDLEIRRGMPRRDGEHGGGGRDDHLARAHRAPLQRAGEIVGHDLKVGPPCRRPKPP